jgi:glucose-1-phosphate cytidylyltransferase
MPHNDDQPKVLLPLAGRPLVEHVMGIYADQGFASFVLAVGYRGEDVERHFAARDLGWTVRFSRAGDNAGTGRRLRDAAAMTDGTFIATYGDGLSDVDLGALLERHREAGLGSTVTVTPMRSQYGTVAVDAGGVVRSFHEKPVLPDVWINGGFFVFDAGVLAGVAGESLEGNVLPALAASGRLAAYEHRGFWRSVDTFKDLEEIEGLLDDADEGRVPWAGLPVSGSS